MESIEDDLVLPIPEDSPSPIIKSKFRRIKKSSTQAATVSIRVSNDPIISVEDSAAPADSSSDKGLEFEDDLNPLFSVPSDDPIVPNSSSPVNGSKGFEDGLDPLFSVPVVDEGFETLDLEREREEEDDGGLNKIGEIGDGIEKEKSARKRLNLDDGSEAISTKRRKKKTKAADKLGKKPKESIREKKRTEKERMAQLEQIHAESQRLLRETRDASFKHVHVVQRPISSVLEKIRLRKLEMLKQTSAFCLSDSVSASDCSMDESVQKNSDQFMSKNDSRNNDDLNHIKAVGSCRSPQDPCGEIPCNNASSPQSENASPTLMSGIQEDIGLLQSNHGDNNQIDDLEESINPHLTSSELNHVPEDILSEEEGEGGGGEEEEKENKENKENIDPHFPSAVSMDSSPEHGLARAFLDDEAEEEDDSDHDLMRFRDNEEEEEESDEDEMLNDLIATGFKEAPVDHEKRNQLHQKWLEQQDAAGTDDILQRLKYGQKKKEPTCLHDDDHDDDDSDDFDEESADEKSHDVPVTDDARQNSKKAKQMIAHMFTDADEPYAPSDDEESEQILLRQRILKQSSESSFISPVDDEHSRKVFGLIKKMNIAPATKKKGRTGTSSFESMVMGANSNSSSKLSFLNRATSTSLPPLHKKASTTTRAFIFGRDDSNSRSGISTSESISDMDLKENNPSKLAVSKVNSTQFKSTAKKKSESSSGSASGSSLFQILRHSSAQFDRQFNKNRGNTKEITETQAAYQFTAFRLGKKATKVESRV